MKLGATIFGILAAGSVAFLLLGLLLPGTWEAEVQMRLPAPPSQVFPHVNDLEAWSDWSPMPEGGVSRFGPDRGPGSGLRWDDPTYGKGQARIVDTHLDSEVQYEVWIEGGSLQIKGTISLEPVGDETLIRWREAGDFGRNPLLGYQARGMKASQSRAMQESLKTLARLLEDSVSDP